MAERKNTATQPVLDNSALLADPDLEKSKVVHALTKEQYSSIIHQVQTVDLDGVRAVVNTTSAKLKELCVARTLNKPHRNKAKGSDQFDSQSIIRWVNGIQADDAESIKQLLGIDATAQLRFKD